MFVEKDHSGRDKMLEVAIVGAGFSGLAAGARLKREGQDSFVILEKADEVGGTWRDNTYPGCACDVKSNLYSFSFAPSSFSGSCNGSHILGGSSASVSVSAKLMGKFCLHSPV